MVSFQTVKCVPCFTRFIFHSGLVFISGSLSDKISHFIYTLLHSVVFFISYHSILPLHAQYVVSMHFASLVEKRQESDSSGWAIWMFDISEDVSYSFILPARCIWEKKRMQLQCKAAILELRFLLITLMCRWVLELFLGKSLRWNDFRLIGNTFCLYQLLTC